MLCVYVVPQLCEQVGEDLVACEGQCYGRFHLHCLGLDMMTKPEDKILCKDCSSGERDGLKYVKP